MNTISLHILGREIFTLRVAEPESTQAAAEPAVEQSEPEPEPSDGFGFYGGNGGSHMSPGWEARTPRPLDAS